MSYNKTTIVGRLGADPEMRYTPAGQPVTSFRVATNRQYPNKDGQVVKETIWFRVTAWGKQGESCNQYLRKGSQVLVEGHLTADPDTGGPRIWNRQDGSPAASFEMNAETVRFLGSKSGNSNEESATPTPEEQIPF